MDTSTMWTAAGAGWAAVRCHLLAAHSSAAGPSGHRTSEQARWCSRCWSASTAFDRPAMRAGPAGGDPMRRDWRGGKRGGAPGGGGGTRGGETGGREDAEDAVTRDGSPDRRPAADAGFSLIEMLIATTLLLLVTG